MSLSQIDFLQPPSPMARAIRLVNRRATWVLADQGVVSLGNFLTITLLARHLAPMSYGAFNVLFDTMLFLNSLQAAIVIYPLTLHGAAGDRSSLGRLATGSLVLSLGLLPILGAAIALPLLAMEGWQNVTFAVAAMFLWQIQETLRRVIIADLRFADVVWGDAVKYLGQAAAIFVLARGGWLDFRLALVVMILSSIASIVIQSLQIGLQPIRFWQLKLVARDFWRLGRWMLITNVSAILTSLAYPYTLTWSHGLESAAVFYAIINLFKLANPIMSSMTGLIVPAVARAMATDGSKAATRIAIRYTAFGAALLMPYFLMLVVVPTFMLQLLYGRDHPYTEYGHLLRLFVANYTACYLLSTLGGWLSALGRSRWLFYSQLANVLVSVGIGLPMTIKWGVAGLIIGGMFSAGVTAIVVVYYIYRAAYRPEKA